MNDDDDDIRKLFEAMKAGEIGALEKFWTLACNELRRIAAQMMAGEKEGHTLQPTALVNESYLRLLKPDGNMPDWNTKGHFFAAVSLAMRRILVESARRRNSQKRGGDQQRTTWNEEAVAVKAPDDEVLRIHAALERLEVEKPELAQVVDMKFFAGMTIAEIAFSLEVSASKIERQWRAARAWLDREISDEE